MATPLHVRCKSRVRLVGSCHIMLLQPLQALPQETHKRNVLWDMRKWPILCFKTGYPFYITCSVSDRKVKDNNMGSWGEPRRFLILIVSLAVCLNIIAVKGEGKLACVVQNTDDKTLQVKLGCDSYPSEPRAVYVAWGKFGDEIHSTG